MAVMNEQAFYSLLAEVQRNSRTIVCVAPAERDKIINVNLDTREIELNGSAYRSFLSIRKEHYAETIYFKVPRFYDGVDLMQMALVIEYVNAKGESYVSPVLTRDVATYPGYILFGWNIHGNATQYAGNLQFAIRFFQIDLNSSPKNLTYSLRTRPATGKILYGVQNDDSEPSAESGFLANPALDEVVSALAQYATTWWTNLIEGSD